MLQEDFRKDFADHLKFGLEELGLHTFLDTKDIPQAIGGEEQWAHARDKALLESNIFILIMTPRFHMSAEVTKELTLARKQGNKTFIYFRHSSMDVNIIVNLGNEVLDISKQEQVAFETKEELVRLAHDILSKRSRELSKEKQLEDDSEIEIVKKFGLSRTKEK